MHSDELLVPDENDEPSEIRELGRRADFISGRVPENEFRNFGATRNKGEKISQLIANTELTDPQTFFQLRKRYRPIVDLILTGSDVQARFVTDAHRRHFGHSNFTISFRLFPQQFRHFIGPGIFYVL